LATLDGEPILIRQGNVTGATFHPELTPDRRVHRAAFGTSSPAWENGHEEAIASH
jgi:glutamine amidotransferase PdxT